MRLTVGPLPPAVYWRRRAIVLGVLLSVVALIVSKCGSDPSGATDQTGKSTAGSKPAPTSTLLTPIVDAPASTAPPASGGTSAGPQPTGPCIDDEVVVTASTEGGKTEYAAGESVKISLLIKNVSGRSCARDVGGAQQELRISQGAQKVWSSDDCGTAGGSNIQTLGPGQEVSIGVVTWTGRTSTSCQNRTVVAPGTYQLIGHVGTEWSEPITLTIKAAK